MEYSKLYDLINYLQYGTKLHIGVFFPGSFGNDMVKLPHRQEIHASTLCEEFKSKDYNRCYRCRKRADYKALKTKCDFGGVCINGIFEYVRPVVINDEVACIIYIGNILNTKKGLPRLLKNTGGQEWLLDTLEKDFDIDKCKESGKLIESYIRVLLENYPKNSKSNPIIDNIKSYIENNLEFDIKISDIAKLFHYNEQYFGRFFKKETKMSFSDYLKLRRLKKAEYLLKNTDDTILLISNKSGFNNVTYFNRIFKKAYGVTPSEYRKKG